MTHPKGYRKPKFEVWGCNAETGNWRRLFNSSSATAELAVARAIRSKNHFKPETFSAFEARPVQGGLEILASLLPKIG